MKNEIGFGFTTASRRGVTVCEAPVAARPVFPTHPCTAARCGPVCDYSRASHLILLVMFFLAGALSGCTKSGGEKPAGVAEKSEAQSKSGVLIDAETQARIGLKTETPVATQWQPEMKGYGRVIDPATLTAAVADLESARTAAEASGKEYERLKTLAEQNNASARALDAARATATHDKTTFESVHAKFALDWGRSLTDGSDHEKIIAEIVNGQAGLVRIDLPAGETLSPPPNAARIVALTDETKAVNGEFSSATDGVNPQTQAQSFFFLVKGRTLTPGAAVTGFLKISGEPVNGVIVPPDAVLRYEGNGWIYVQTADNQFLRTEIPLDRLTDNGWFVSGDLTATNRVVISGAQTVLSAEMSGGEFNTGTRD